VRAPGSCSRSAACAGRRRRPRDAAAHRDGVDGMNRKQFLFLVLALIVLGGAGIALFRQDIADYRASGAKIGARLLPQYKLADVAQMRLQESQASTAFVSVET